MTDFSHLKSLDVSGEKTVSYNMYQVDLGAGHPVLQVRPASQSNKSYFNAVLKRAAANKGRGRRNLNSLANAVTESRAEDRLMYPQHIVVDWTGVTDASGNEVPYSVDAATDFLAALPDWIFDELTAFCREPSNFSSADEAAMDIEATSKN